MDYVYICRAGNNEELRYSIRSLVKNLPDVNVWVVGYKPDWYSGNFMPVIDRGNKFANIHNALTAMCDNDNISNDFVLMNDDFFVIDQIDSIPVMHGGLLKDKIYEYNQLARNSLYVRMLTATYDRLLDLGIANPIDYDIHVPMHMNRQKLKEVARKNVFPRSTYGNLAEVGGDLIKDVKTYSSNSVMSTKSNDHKNPGTPFISTEDKSFKIVYNEVLNGMFEDASPYELM